MVLASARLAAHDFWLAATPWDPGTQVTISANLGEIFPVATDRVVAEGVERWRVLGPGGEVHLDDALRKDGRVLTADVQLPAPGAYLATMTITPHLTRMQGPLVQQLPGGGGARLGGGGETRSRRLRAPGH